MAITRVQYKNGSTVNGSNVAATFDSSVTSGNLIVAIISSYYGDATIPTPSISDSQTNSYTLATSIVNATTDAFSELNQYLYYAANVTGGTNTVTFSGGGSGAYLTLTILEYSGLATASVLDQVNKFRYYKVAHGDVQTTTYTSNNVTTTQNDELLIGAGSVQNQDIYTVDGAWTRVTYVYSTGAKSHVVQERIVSATLTDACDGSLSAAQNLASGIVATFKMAGGAPPASTTDGKIIFAAV